MVVTETGNDRDSANSAELVVGLVTALVTVQMNVSGVQVKNLCNRNCFRSSNRCCSRTVLYYTLIIY